MSDISKREQKKILKENIKRAIIKDLKEADESIIKTWIKQFVLDNFKNSKFMKEITKDITNEVLRSINITIDFEEGQ